jgi:carboxymethylenebutenolidase
MQNVLQREETSKGKAARQHLQFILLTTEQLDDVTAALSFLKTVPRVDAKRIAVVGHSFGGQLTLLAVDRDNTLRAAITFAAAADSWARSAELRERLLTAVRQATAPIMLIQADNDYSTAAGRALSAELDRMHKPHLLEIYGAVGQTPDDGHNAVYLAIPIWEPDVFKFLDEYVGPQ